MTLTESVAAIRNHLTQHPSDQLARSALADALEELGDPSASGYRALVKWGLYPFCYALDSWYWTNADNPYLKHRTHELLPADWFALLDWGYASKTNKGVGFFHPDTAQQVAALAFTRLPPERQEELLRGPD